MKGLAQKALVGLAWLMVLGVFLQFFFAGLGLPQLGGEGMDLHEAFGYSALHLTPIILIVVALIARAPMPLIITTVVFAIVSFVQPIWVSEFRGEFLASMHIVGAAVILAMAHAIASAATKQLRDKSE